MQTPPSPVLVWEPILGKRMRGRLLLSRGFGWNASRPERTLPCQDMMEVVEGGWSRGNLNYIYLMEQSRVLYPPLLEINRSGIEAPSLATIPAAGRTKQ